MIESVSKNLGLALEKRIGSGPDAAQVYAYALEIIIGAAVKAVIVLVIAMSLGILDTTLLCLTVFAALRRKGGGAHMKTYAGCLAVGCTMMIFWGWLAASSDDIAIMNLCWWITLILGGLAVVRWVPAGTDKKTITDEKIRADHKIAVSLILGSCLLLSLLLMSAGCKDYAAAIIYGLFWGIFLLTPLGYQVIGTIDRLLDYLK